MSIQYLFELIGTGFFAISGAIRATDRSKPDWFGVTFIGFITAIGGGSLRDMLLGSYPLVWVNDPTFLYAIFSGIILARLGHALLLKWRRIRLLFDTLGIAMFTILGTEKALSLGVQPVPAAMMGMFSAVMGGVIRDVLTQREPVIFSREVYATACIAGAGCYVLLDAWGLQREVNFCCAGMLIVGIRLAAVRYRLSLPEFPVGKGR